MNECNIVSDLMPLYADEVASPDSVEYITRHIAWCPECAEVWKRLSTTLPEVDPREEAKNYRKAFRRGKRRMFLKSLALCLIALVIGTFFLYYQLYVYGVYPITMSYPSPDGKIILEVVEKEDAPIFYTAEGLMVRFKLKDDDDDLWALNRHATTWDTLTAHWSTDSHHVVLDVVTLDGEHALFITDASLEYRNGGLIEIPGITENLIPIFEEALRSEVDIGELTFSFGAWNPDGETAYFRYEMESGYVGSIDYHYPTGTIKSIR